MFMYDKVKAGKYLERLVKESSDYGMASKFGRAFLKAQGDDEKDPEKQKLINNKLSQIFSGKKSIMIYDLPIFAELLDVSCEEILSGGKNLRLSAGIQPTILLLIPKTKRFGRST